MDDDARVDRDIGRHMAMIVRKASRVEIEDLIRLWRPKVWTRTVGFA